MIAREKLPVPEQQELDVVAIFRAVWRRKVVVIITTIVTVAAALLLALTATPIFRAEVTITEVSESPDGSGGGLSQLSGLASLAGVNLTGAGKGRERAAVLESRRLAEEFVKRNGVIDLLSAGSQKPLSLWLAVKQFRKDELNIAEDKIKGVTVISMNWTDPVTAARWANQFVALANELMRNRAIDDANRNIAYLNKQIEGTKEVELQRVMYNIVETQMKTLMLASGRNEYAFSVVDPAVAPEVRYSPRRTLIVLTGFALGVLIGSILAAIYDKVAESRFRNR
jgi:uncharacterized protein involved in exopolysaccharide biosynthesis